RPAPENVALEIDELGQRLLDEPTAVEAFEADPLLDPVERRRDLRGGDHALLGHQGEVAPDLTPSVGEHRGGAAGRPVLDVDQGDARATESERERDLASHPSRPE